MPASERSFAEPLPEWLYCDTDLLIAFLVAAEPHHTRARILLVRAAAAGTGLYLSSLSWMEYLNVVIKERFRQRLPGGVAQQLRLIQWQNASIRRSYSEFMLAAFDTALAEFTTEEVALTPAVRRAAMGLVGDYDLRPHDAVHLASAFAAGCFDLASFDQAFRRVDGLVLWNDRIHAPRR